ncbi:MAG: hypothetical protein WDZ94_01665 [Patescibacteria group bacterium]
MPFILMINAIPNHQQPKTTPSATPQPGSAPATTTAQSNPTTPPTAPQFPTTAPPTAESSPTPTPTSPNTTTPTPTTPTSTMTGDTAAATPPSSDSPSQDPGAIHTPGAQPHGQAGDFSDDLAKKVGQHTPEQSQATDSLQAAPTVSPVITTSPTGADASNTSGSNNTPKKKKGPRNTIIAAVVLFLVVAGGGAGFYLTQQNQDVRQQAASEEVTDTEIDRSSAEWARFNDTWESFIEREDSSWIDYVAFAQSAGARYDCHAPIMTVGSETLYGCDLNALFALYELEAYIQPNQISPQDSTLNSVLDRLITNSGILQEAEAQNLLTLDDTIYNNSSKDTLLRYETLADLREQFADQFEKRVDFEAISIYFHNQVAPEIPLEEAKTAAKAKMDNLYARLQSGEITMEQAGAEIRADSIQGDETGVSLAQMDEQFQENAYMVREGHIFNSRIFKDPVFDDELRSLGEGQLSTVRLCQDYAFTDADYAEAFTNGVTINPEMVDSCYMIFKVNTIEFGLFGEGDQAENVENLIKENYSEQTDIDEQAL